ncbi:MAG TPA: neuraminidase-like domain-containing protein, partial [Thermoanaerobaculia bacterium]|nr:neuraminidase-like domain-containing protein [Thermoanaerobaculia bacterium]
MANEQDVSLKIRVLDAPQGKFLGGTVDITCEHTRLNERLERRAVDASHEIAISGLRRGPEALYKVFVTRADPRVQKAQVVNVPSSGIAMLDFVFEQSGGGGEEPPEIEDTQERERIVAGQVLREDGQPFAGGLVRAFHVDKRGLLRLGQDSTDETGHYTIRYEKPPEVAGVELRVTVNGEDGIPDSFKVVHDAKPLEIVDLTVPLAGPPAARRWLEGRIVLEHGLPAEKLRLRLVRRDFGGAETRLAETTTLAGGLYALPFDAGGKTASLEVRAVDATGKEIPLSKTLHNLRDQEKTAINLVAPSALQPLAAEYRRLATDLTPHVGDMAKLSGAKETAERQDLTVLNRATGWDARLIALASNAARLHAEEGVGLSQDVLYGLLRAGLPSDRLQLAQVGPEVVEKALGKVKEAGIVDLSANQIGEARKQFETFSRETRLAVPAPGSRSTYGDLLTAARVSEDTREKFAPVFLSHRGKAEDLWKKAEQAGVAPGDIQALKRQGKLAFLTSNSEPMTRRLQQGLDVTDPVELVEKGFYRPEKWADEVRALAANGEPLAALIPPAYEAEQVEERLSAYAEDMARKVRLSYPTQVIAHRIEHDPSGEWKLGNGAPDTAKVLKNAAAQGFRLGETPVEAFLRDHPGVVTGADADAARQGMKTLQRVYQISPGDDAMPTLMSLGLTSAYDVVALPQEMFLERYGSYFASLDQARLVYRKAQQVTSVTYNLFTIAKKLESDTPVHGLSAPAEVRDEVKKELEKQFPTLESLFGSLDFCDCDHCRSVLSPAAYLVDLLQFVDVEKEVWENFLAKWKKEHGNADYPHVDAGGKALRPYDVLIERRPDLANIELTCSNTHTALPYIDIVNEILEYYVAHGKLDEAAAHDTGEATTPELLAEPQNVIAEAYDEVGKARYPLDLPFDLWLETVRRFCDAFDTPLWQLLETFRPGDELFAPAQPFDRARLFVESLGLSPSEYGLLTAPDALDKWHELYGYPSAVAATTEATDPETGLRIDLNSAKALSRRLGVTYKELVEIVRTGFVNPKLAELGILYKLGVTVQDVLFYEKHRGLLAQNPDTLSLDDQQRRDEAAAFEKQLEELTAEHSASGFDAKAWLNGALADDVFDGVLVLADPDAGCDFDRTIFRYADGKPADAITFLRINLFVRLWRKLGWSVEETDRALQAFLPKNVPFDAAHIAQSPLKSALLGLAHLKELEGRVQAGKQGRLKLITFWSDLATTGKKPLYAQLFLTPGVLKTDAVFDHPLGLYLSAPGVPLAAHLLALQGALGLTADEIGRILEDAGTPVETAGLSLANVSRLYRYGLLARSLKLSVRELLALKELSGLDPFEPLLLDAPETIEEDHPFSRTLRFVAIAGEVKESGLKMEDLDYLLRHRIEDPAGKYRPDREGTLALLKTLAEGVRAIRAQHAVPADPGTIDEETLRQKLGLALPPDVVARFLALMNGTVELTEAHGFFEKHLQKQAPGVQPASGFLEAADFDLLFDPSLPLAPGETEQGRVRSRKTKLAHAFFPFLQERLIRQLIVQALIAQTGADPALVESLLTDARLLTEVLPPGPPKPFLEAFAATGERGIDAHFFVSNDGSGARQETSPVLASADTALKNRKDLPAAGSARFEGYLEVPAPGPYRFFVQLDKQNAQAELRFDHLPDPVVLSGTAAGDGAEVSEVLELKTGALYRLTLTLRNLGGGEARLLVQGETLPKDSLAQLTLYSQAGLERGERALTVLRKALQFLETFELTEREIRYLLAHAADFDGLSLSGLPARESGGTPAEAGQARDRFTAFLRLAGYVRLKRGLAGGTDGLIDVFEAETPGEAREAIAKLARRDKATVEAAAGALPAAPAYRDERAVERLWMALQAVERLGVPAASIAQWTRIVDRTATAGERFEIARSLREAVKARFDPEAWQRVAMPIFDKLRQRQRDALVAFLLHKKSLDRREQLYEHFLIDPGMEPVVQTSRIRLAIASVQLFVQRCLLNLEKQVSPSAINARHWEWMKRYRVWEANRKIFLFPENWLEPEFRDDKTHLFAELEGALLQGDVSSDLVEDAFLTYLKKLDELARLDIVAMHLEDNADPASNTLHVIGRTYSQPHKYFYRRYAHGMWTPWEPVTAEIEGDHLAPVVWRNRLYLFWVTFMDKPNSDPKPGSKTSGSTIASAKLGDLVSDIKVAAATKQVDVQLHWSEHLEGEWSTPQSGGYLRALEAWFAVDSDGTLHAILTSYPLNVPLGFDPRSAFVHVAKEPYENGEERGVFIHLSGGINQSFYLAGRNSAPALAGYASPPANPYSSNATLANRYSGNGALTVTFKRRISTEDGKPPVNTVETPKILEKGGGYTLLPCDNDITLGSPEIASLVKPLFYQDDAHTLFIEPNVTERTIEEWQEWVTHTPQEPVWQVPDWDKEVLVIPQFPKDKWAIPRPEDPDWGTFLGRDSVLGGRPGQDWVVNAATGVMFGEELVLAGGRSGAGGPGGVRV